MLISKFDLYKSGWLELVFENRNKEYGAYYLRQHYAGNVNRAMAITFTCLIFLVLVGQVIGAGPAAGHHIDVGTVVTLSAPPKPLVIPPKPAEPIKAEPVKMTKLTPFVVKPDELADPKPPVTIDIQGAIGPANVEGKDVSNVPATLDVPVAPAAPGPDVSIHLAGTVDVMPEPIGGETAWSKFLNKNLRFPPGAEQSGRVILSFVIEKDGHLSDITVLRSAGADYDEEALRVLKLAKPWKPGMQNGQPVRVRFTIPINFQVADQN